MVVRDAMKTRSQFVSSDGSGTQHIQGWAQDYIETVDLNEKRHPRAAPNDFSVGSFTPPQKPGRPSELLVTRDKPRTIKPGSLFVSRSRAELNHRFWHHELQAAELFCWALLRFADAETEFKRGLLRIVHDEVRHMGLYEERIRSDGYEIGAFPVRDWFWDRIPTCQSKLQFVALMGMGLEAANLEHTERFAQWFRAVGDEASALVQDQVGHEEIAHVRFSNRWFETWTGGVTFERWKASLPAPLSPLLMRGKTLAHERRLKALFPAAFIDELANWQPDEAS